jgi:hypothetical protein
MKSKNISLTLLIALFGGPILAVLNSSCMGPAGRSQVRQESRVDNRVDHRQERRRGWD